MGNQSPNSGESRTIFNEKYHLLQQIGTGKTANVYLIESIENPTKQFALKIFRKSLKKASSPISTGFNCVAANL